MRGLALEILDQLVGVIDAGPQRAGNLANKRPRRAGRRVDPGDRLATGVKPAVSRVADDEPPEVVDAGLEPVGALDQTVKLFEQAGAPAQSEPSGE